MSTEKNYSKGVVMTNHINAETKKNVDHGMNRRLPQIALTSVPIDIKAFGETFFLLSIDQRGEKTDYLVASLARKLDKIRITINGAPQIDPNDVRNGNMIQVTVSGLQGRFWQTQTGAGVYFTASAIKKVLAK